MNRFNLKLVPCGSAEHKSDIAALRARGLSVPHDFSHWPSHSSSASWIWCRALAPNSELESGFAIRLANSRAVPGMRIGRVDRIGRTLHGKMLPIMGQALNEAARQIPRLLRLEVRVFDEIPQRRAQFAASIVEAGGHPVSNRKSYSHTLFLAIDRSADELMKSFSRRTRQDIRKFLDSRNERISLIQDARYKRRISQLYRASFARTGGFAPALDIDAMFEDARQDCESVLLGTFVSDRAAPEDLVAFAWGRLHGDHLVYEAGGSEKSERFRHLPPGYGLVWGLATWARERGAEWLDLGGIIAGDATTTNDRLAGIGAFKRRFSNDERHVAEEFFFEPNVPLALLARFARSLAAGIGIRKTQ